MCLKRVDFGLDDDVIRHSNTRPCVLLYGISRPFVFLFTRTSKNGRGISGCIPLMWFRKSAIAFRPCVQINMSSSPIIILSQHFGSKLQNFRALFSNDSI